MLILGVDDNVSENFGPYEDNESEEQDIKGDHKNLLGESSDTGSYARDNLSECTLLNGLLANNLSISLKEARFSE